MSNSINYGAAIREMCDRLLAINKILEKQEKCEVSKEESYDEIDDLVYDDWYIQQIKDNS